MFVCKVSMHLKSVTSGDTPMGKYSDSLQDLVRERTCRLETANTQLRESEERFRLLVDGAKDHAIFMLGPDGIVVSWNSGAEVTKGYSAPEIIGRHISCFYVPEDVERGEPERLLKAAAEHGVTEAQGWRVRKAVPVSGRGRGECVAG